MSKLIYNKQNSNVLSRIKRELPNAKFRGVSSLFSISTILELVNDQKPIFANFLIPSVLAFKIPERFYSTNKDFNILDKKSYPKYEIISKYEDIIEILEDEDVLFKIYKGNKKLNARAYSINDEKLYLGSANLLTYEENNDLELGFMIKDTEDVKEFTSEFDSLFNSSWSDDVNNEIIDEINDLVEPLTLEEIFTKIVNKLFGDESWEKDKKLGEFFESDWFKVLWPHQQVAVAKALKAFENDDAETFMISDEVGLGKTASAVAIAAYYSKFARGGIKVLAPKNIVSSNWNNFKVKGGQMPFKEAIDLFADSSSDLQRDEFVANLVASSFDNVKLLIIDESQYFKADSNKKVNRLAEITREAVAAGMKVLLLTATPISNNLMELYNQLSLGGTSSQLLKMEKDFKSHDKEITNNPDNFEFSEKIINFIRVRVIARTKENLKERSEYIDLPKLKEENVHQVRYGEFRNQEKIINLIGELSRKSQMHALVRFGMMKRLEESVEALLASLRKGVLLDEDGSVTKFSKYDQVTVDELIKVLENELEAHVKNSSLMDILDKKNGKYIIFSSSIPTIEAIYKNLIEYFPGKTIAFIHGTGMKSTHSTRYSKEQLIYLAAKKYNKPPRGIEINDDEIEILILSNAFAEGQNLQSFNNVINYDLTWNPMILQQRLGRIYRLGSKFSEISLYNFWPDEKISNYLGLENKFSVKTGKSLLISELPDIFGFKKMIGFERTPQEKQNEEADAFRRASMQVLNTLNPISMTGSKIETGWYSIINGPEDQLFNLFKSENGELHFVRSDFKQVFVESNKNLLYIKSIGKECSDINKDEFDKFKNTPNIFDKWNKELEKQIVGLNKRLSSKKDNKYFTLVSTIIMKKVD